MNMNELLSAAPAAPAAAVVDLTDDPAPASTPPASSAPAARKDPAVSVQGDEEGSEEEFDEDNPEWAKWSCDQIRTRIRKFLATKEMTQTAWLKLIDVNSNSYRRFMNVKGKYAGSGNSTYKFAAVFFYRREKQAAMANKTAKPQERKRKAAADREERAKKAKSGADLLKRIAEMELEQLDEDGVVPVFDDCDEIRKKINAFLGEKLVTQAAFLRALGNVNSNSLRNFLTLKRGAGSGAANVVYRTAYVFFEKKRLLEGGKKTKRRLDNEAKQGRSGFPLRHDNGKRWVFVGIK